MFKIGSQVRLIANLPLGFGRNNEISGINEQSKELQGKIVTIDSIVLGGTQTPMYYEIKEDNGAGQWTPQMIQQIVNPSNAEDEFKIYAREDDGNVDKHIVDHVGQVNNQKIFVAEINGCTTIVKPDGVVVPQINIASGADVAKYKEDMQEISEYKELTAKLEEIEKARSLVKDRLKAKGYQID